MYLAVQQMETENALCLAQICSLIIIIITVDTS